MIDFSDKNMTAGNTDYPVGDSSHRSVSLFGIIVVGLIMGLVVGLVASPNYTLQGFLLGFSGGALIVASAYLLTTGVKRS